jgi:hypothetical protein
MHEVTARRPGHTSRDEHPQRRVKASVQAELKAEDNNPPPPPDE